MQFTTFVTGLAAIGLAQAAGSFTNSSMTLVAPTTRPASEATAATGSVVVVTDTVTALTTFCPASTQITTNGKTYTVTSATTLTITDCPCTVKRTTTLAPPSKPTGVPPPVQGNATVVYTTQTVQTLTTYCPSATTIVTNGKTYTATGPSTLTITNCPCTVVQSSTVPVGPPAANTPVPPANAPGQGGVATTVKPGVGGSNSPASNTIMAAGAGKIASGTFGSFVVAALAFFA